MKTIARIASYFTLLFILITIGTAQDKPKRDISIYYALLSSPEVFASANEYYQEELEADGISRSGTGYWGSFGATFRHFFTDLQSVTAVATYTSIHADLSSGGNIVGESTRQFYTLAAEWNIHFLRLETYQMYGGGGIGATFIFEDNSFYTPGYNTYADSRVYPNFDFTVLGMRFGRNIGAFLEFGFGYKGLFRFGISGQF